MNRNSHLKKVKNKKKGAVKAPANKSEFASLFDGKSLKGWKGNPKLWSVKDGVIVGKTTPENKIKRNTFLIHESEVKDFGRLQQYTNERRFFAEQTKPKFSSIQTKHVQFRLQPKPASSRKRVNGQNNGRKPKGRNVVKGRKFEKVKGQKKKYDVKIEF